ncbi:unnamed protein product [Lactuca virosa]|uniref:Nudix hydrolase domain-containing protein n=1 Tax=Lactuca virosa TaxID=75947 RepID=A0AAU9PU61_9ASTR|nr:unnamed protein product [Lactuca virosa]
MPLHFRLRRCALDSFSYLRCLCLFFHLLGPPLPHFVLYGGLAPVSFYFEAESIGSLLQRKNIVAYDFFSSSWLSKNGVTMLVFQTKMGEDISGGDGMRISKGLDESIQDVALREKMEEVGVSAAVEVVKFY